MTLVEVIVALAIFMIVIVMAFPIITYAGQLNAESNRRLTVQEQGILIAEYLTHNAKGFTNKQELISFLSTPKQPEMDFGAFSCSLNQCEHKEGKQSIIITFDDSNQVRINVTESRQTYESVVWMNYEK